MPVMAWNEKFSKEHSDEILDGLRKLYSGRLSTWESSPVDPWLSIRTVLASPADCARGGLSPDTLLQSSALAGRFSTAGGVLDFLTLRQIGALFEKNADFDFGIDKRQVAKEKWLAAERRCAETNDIFKAYHRGGFYFPRDVDGIFYSASRKIAYVLGNVPKISELRLRFGPGATTTLQKRRASPRYKLGDTKSCSEGLLNIITDVAESMPSWFGITDQDDYIFDVNVAISKVSFVPKNAKTDRPIAVEPVLNLMVQLGIGDYIAGRLLRSTGIDLSDQGRNQALARVGSITNALATLDLSSASDLISVELVKSLLPPDWFDLLNNCRSTRCDLDGETIMLHKFSSMGNGFTFPLQTLIFWALMSATCESMALSPAEKASISVYGDDIIVPCPDQDPSPYYRVLETAGFLVNHEKSFSSGTFRESCGKDYYLGIDVRPQFVRDRLSYCELFKLANAATRSHDLEVRDYLLSYVPEPIRLYGPDGYGDGHLIVDNPLHFAVAHRRNDGWGGYTFETYSLKGRKSFRPSPGDYVYPAYSIYVSGGISNAPHAFKGDTFAVDLPGTSGYKRIKIYTLGF